MVRAGQGAVLFERFKEMGRVAIGWSDMGSLMPFKTREQIAERYRQTWPDENAYQVGQNAGQMYRFRSEIAKGDIVITYNPASRVYLVGEVDGDYVWDTSFDEHFPNCRPVKWQGEVSRDHLTPTTRNSLGSIATLFLLSGDAAGEIADRLAVPEKSLSVPSEDVEKGVEADILGDFEVRALEFIKDRVAKLDWAQMQELVAGLLRAMGYKTRVSAQGADRGRDIFASRDGLGLEDPRIFVEVKHRKGTIGSQDIRSFIGGRRPGDRCLYVSSGGFTKDALYEAERSAIPLTLID
jgi:restriction system protein